MELIRRSGNVFADADAEAKQLTIDRLVRIAYQLGAHATDKDDDRRLVWRPEGRRGGMSLAKADYRAPVSVRPSRTIRSIRLTLPFKTRHAGRAIGASVKKFSTERARDLDFSSLER